MVEVEERGLLNEETYKRLKKLLEEKGKPVTKEERLLLDYTTPLEGIGDRNLDVRVRITNGIPEIIVKKGSFGGGAREEASVLIKDSSLENAIHLMALLGYRKAVKCHRKIERYMIDDIEVSIQDVIDMKNGKLHSRFFELEILCPPEKTEEARNKLKEWAQLHDLTLFSDEEWYKYVEKLNREANDLFDYDKDDVKDVTRYGHQQTEEL